MGTSGGDIDHTQTVSEDEIFILEREAIGRLGRNEKSLDRMEHVEDRKTIKKLEKEKMVIYNPPVKDYEFLFNEVFDIIPTIQKLDMKKWIQTLNNVNGRIGGSYDKFLATNKPTWR